MATSIFLNVRSEEVKKFVSRNGIDEIFNLSSIIHFIDKQDIKSFNRAIKVPGVLNLETAEGSTLLMYAAEKGKAIFVRLLLKKASLTQLSTKGARMAAIHYAAKSGKVDIMQLFIKHGEKLNILDGCGRSALDVARFYHQGKGNLWPKIENLLKAANIRTGAAILADLPSMERTIVLNGQREVCYQVALRIFRSQKKENFGERLKVEYGISLEAHLLASIQQKVQEDEIRPKEASSDAKKREMPKKEVPKTEPTKQESPEPTACVTNVNKYIMRGNAEELESFLERFDNKTRKTWNFGKFTPFISAFSFRSINPNAMFKVLLQYFPFHINARNQYRQTPLHLAFINNFEETISTLVHHSNTELNALDSDGKTPMDYVKDKENFKWKEIGLKTAKELTLEERKTFCAWALKEYCNECLRKDPSRKFTPKEIVDYLDKKFGFSYPESKIATYLKAKGWLKLEETVSVANDDGKTEVTYELVEVEEEVEVDDDEDPVSTNPNPDEEEVSKPAGGGRVPDYLDVD